MTNVNFLPLIPNRSREVKPLQPFSYGPLPSLSLAGRPSDPIPLYLQGAPGYHSPHLAPRVERGICGGATAPPSNPQGFLGSLMEEGKTGRWLPPIPHHPVEAGEESTPAPPLLATKGALSM